MADTVNLFGSQVKKGYVIAGGVVLVAAVAYGWYKNRQSAQQAGTAAAGTTAASPSGDPYPPDGTTGNPSDPYSTDPATGETYGDEADGGYIGDGLSNLGGYYGNSGLYGDGTGFEQPGDFTSDAYWAQYCEQYMGSSGDDSISQALGAYITGAQVTSDEVSIIEQAIAIAGFPPVAGTNGYPPSINTGGSGNGSGGNVSVPDVVGMNVEQATSVLKGAGLKASGPAGVKNVVHTVTAQNPAAGSSVPSGTVVTLSYKTTNETAPKPPPATDTVAVPDLIGMSQADAYTAIARSGLKAATTTPPRKGKVIYVQRQSPAAGTKVKKGSKVTVTSASTPNPAK